MARPAKKKPEDPPVAAPVVVETRQDPPPVVSAVLPPPPPPPPPPLSKGEKCLARCKGVAELKRAWMALEQEIAEDVKAAAAAKAQYEEARSALGQEELDWARMSNWIGAL